MISVKFEGGTELLAALNQLPARASKRVQREALVDAGETILAPRMAKRAPRGDPKQPNLAEEMTVSNARGRDAQEVAVAVGPSKRAWYGSFQELGTSRHAAQPFARPAFDESIMDILQMISRAMWLSLAARKITRSATVSGPVQSGPGGGGLL